MLDVEVLIPELLAVDGLSARALDREISRCSDFPTERWLTFPRVKSPPWAMNPEITRWKAEPAYPKPFSPVARLRKLVAVFGTTSS
jgi:hypothetical protein